MRRPHLALTSIALLLCAACSGTKTDRAAESPAPDYGPTVRTAVTALGKSTAAFDEKVEIMRRRPEFRDRSQGPFRLRRGQGDARRRFP